MTFRNKLVHYGQGLLDPRPIPKLHDHHLILEEIKRRLNSGNACYHSIQNLTSSHQLSTNLKIKIHHTAILSVVLYVCVKFGL
jgi:hypothetical protein